MSKERTQAPEVYARQRYVSERVELIREYSAKDPDHEYIWKSTNTTIDEMAKLGAEPVKRDGELVTNGIEMLCRVPKVQWIDRIRKQEETSLREMKNIVGNYAEGNSQQIQLVQTRNPKRPIG